MTTSKAQKCYELLFSVSAMMNAHKCTVSSNITLEIEPRGAPNLPKFRLVDIYAKGTEGNVREATVESFCNSSRKLRIVIGTTAFGMGLDCPNVWQIILWDPPFVAYI